MECPNDAEGTGGGPVTPKALGAPASEPAPEHGRRRGDAPRIAGVGLIALGMLVLQNTSVILLTRYTCLPGRQGYSGKVAVFLTECLKLLISCCMVACEEQGLRGQLRHKVLTDKAQLLRMSVPSLLYVMQNLAIYVALANVEAAIFQVTYQLKLLVGAVLSLLFFPDRRIGLQKWVAVTILFVGIGLASLPAERADMATGSPVLGVLAAASGATLSGFASVYMEASLKSEGQSLWLKNMQLSGYGVLFAGAAVLSEGSVRLTGVDGAVWGVILLQAAGGLIVAVVLKHCDSIIKNFSTSISVILSSALSVYLFNFAPSDLFVLGAVMVIFATLLYNGASTWIAPFGKPGSYAMSCTSGWVFLGVLGTFCLATLANYYQRYSTPWLAAWSWVE